MMMAMAVSIFVPRSSKLLWFLRTHFNRCKDAKYVFFLISCKSPFRRKLRAVQSATGFPLKMSDTGISNFAHH
jgi:hypothetical protein